MGKLAKIFKQIFSHHPGFDSLFSFWLIHFSEMQNKPVYVRRLRRDCNPLEARWVRYRLLNVDHRWFGSYLTDGPQPSPPVHVLTILTCRFEPLSHSAPGPPAKLLCPVLKIRPIYNI